MENLEDTQQLGLHDQKKILQFMKLILGKHYTNIEDFTPKNMQIPVKIVLVGVVETVGMNLRFVPKQKL